MKIKNSGQKIVHVGSVMILPGETGEIDDATAAAPSVQALISKGMLTPLGGSAVDTAKRSEPAKKA